MNTFYAYLARDGWRWRLQSTNGRTIAESGEAYTRKRDCLRAIDRVRLAASSARLVVVS